MPCVGGGFVQLCLCQPRFGAAMTELWRRCTTWTLAKFLCFVLLAGYLNGIQKVEAGFDGFL